MLFFYIMERGYFHSDVRSKAQQPTNDENITIEFSELSLFAKYEENLQGQE
jgi:hypothetical protein